MEAFGANSEESKPTTSTSDTSVKSENFDTAQHRTQELFAIDNALNSKIPVFTGAGTDVPLTLWLDTIERYKRLHNWSDEDTAEAAILRIQGKASTWRRILQKKSLKKRPSGPHYVPS